MAAGHPGDWEGYPCYDELQAVLHNQCRDR